MALMHMKNQNEYLNMITETEVKRAIFQEGNGPTTKATFKWLVQKKKKHGLDFN